MKSERTPHHRDPRRNRPSSSIAALTAIAVGAAAAAGGGCASEYTIVDRSALVISDNARVTAASVLPGASRRQQATAHLALAQELYGKQLDLLKERRNKVRARRRTMNLLSYSVLAAAGIAAGAVALGADSSNAHQTGGVAALGGVALGTGFQIGGLMQEDPATVDDKIRHLQSIYEAMLDKVRGLVAKEPGPEADAAVGAAIEAFINEALRINVKG